MALVQKSTQGKTFEERVKKHFNRGICELTSMVSCLHKAKKGISFFMELKEHIEKATKELGISEKLVLQDLENVDSMTSEILVSKKKLMDEQKTKANELANLQTFQRDLERLGETQRENYRLQRAMKEQAERDKATAEDNILVQEERKRDGWLLMLIPVVGTVIGGIQALDAHMAQKTAEEQANAAQKMIRDCRAKEQKAFHEVAKCEEQLKEQQSKIKATQKSLKAMEDKKKELTNYHREILNLQEALRSCSRLVGTLNSEANVVKVTSQYVFIYNSLKDQIDSIVQHMLPFLHMEKTEYRLLDSPKIKQSIRKLKFYSETPSTLDRNIYALKDQLNDENIFWYFIIGFAILAFLWATGLFYKVLLAIIIGFTFFSWLYW
ncbi:uncharacterized protein LOC134488940 [Candoia aspera]|uniref:uncharacterized protein LOC134488940 n=1 Tax=Candoia aspera TaxID=51853 RepID=UPI002FD7E42D